ncbi:MAG: S8 family serine peptidase [Clostridia bacterium]|nr:S8 family serine peptidase [Clostridia bacterium]
MKNNLFRTIISLILTSFLIFSNVFAFEMVSRGTVKTNFDDEVVTFIVELESDSVLKRAKNAGVSVLSEDMEDFFARTVQSSQKAAVACAEDVVDSAVEATYTHILNGFSIKGKRSMIDELKSIDNVKNVYISQPRYKTCADESGLTSDSFMQQYTEIGLDKLNSSYTGKGIVVGVVDSELQCDHTAFKTAPEVEKLTEDSISEKLETLDLIAEEKYGVLSASDVYKNAKIPYAFDYAGVDTDTETDVKSSYHGTHVSGIIAGKSDEFCGVAKDAQIVFMKAKADNSAYFYDEHIMNALEDLVKLDVDIINMSLGVTAGPSDSNIVSYNEIFREIEEVAKIPVIAAAGNDGRMGYKFGTGAPLASQPDYGLVAAPASLLYSTAVASLQLPSSSGTGTKMAKSSAWGVTPDLRLKPDVTAVGGNVVSAAYNNAYETKSGTSMAAAQYSGAMAVMLEYINDSNPSLPAKIKQSRAQQLLCSSAVPFASNGVYSSPRQQGAGVINLAKATNTPVVLYQTSDEKTKIELGDNLQKMTNVTFCAENLGDTEVTYNLSGHVLIDDYYRSSGINLVGNTKILQNAKITFETSTITIQPLSKGTINAVLDLSAVDTDTLENVFANGFFVDGFITLTPQDTSFATLSIPFMGFYGDWTKAPIFSPNNIYDWEIGTEIYSSENGLLGQVNSDLVLLGAVKNADQSTIVFYSTNSDMTGLSLHFDNKRNITDAKAVVKNSKGEVVKTIFERNYLPKASNMDAFYERNFTMTNSSSGVVSPLEDGMYTVEVDGRVDYPGTSVKKLLSFDICMDTVYPQIEDAYYAQKESGDKYIYIKTSDNNNFSNHKLLYCGEECSPAADQTVDGYTAYNVNNTNLTDYSVKVTDPAYNTINLPVLKGTTYVATYNGEMLKKVDMEDAWVVGRVLLNKPTILPENQKYFVWDENLAPMLER